MKNVSVILASYDGIINNYCGVGTSVISFINGFTKIREVLLKENINLVLHLVSPALISDSLGYSDEIRNNSIKIARASGGDLHLITNSSDGMIPYGQMHNWQTASVNLASKALEISQNYDENLVFCFDTPFAHAPYYINLQKAGFGVKDVKSIIVFESDVFIHEPKNPSFERIGWEASALKYAEFENSIIIANTGEFISNHLIAHYGLSRDKMVDLVQGINPDLERYKKFSDDEVKNYLVNYNIPLDKKLIFSVGRAVEYKGFDLLLEAYSKIKEDAHLVFVASPYKTEASFVEELEKIIKDKKLNCTPIFACDFQLPRYICQWHNTKIVAQLSKCEPFGLVPEEVRLWGKNTGPVILASNKDGFVEQIEDGVDGFLVNLSDTSTIASKMDEILKLNESEIQKIKQNAINKFSNNFDYRVNILKCFTQVIDGIDSTTFDELKSKLTTI